ncbi:hypothetical protein GCM10023196_025090 [Actinoallomurus vinaceus]|uniref:Uncharacterized protein n=1 Tax=Actinoallomurus vinaceus TaxID=1080074 RepID=A0ABP8U7U0_9ACTN
MRLACFPFLVGLPAFEQTVVYASPVERVSRVLIVWDSAATSTQSAPPWPAAA